MVKLELVVCKVYLHRTYEYVMQYFHLGDGHLALCCLFSSISHEYV
jgi:hypothetical protein